MKKEPAAPVTTELDNDDAALEWARRDSIVMEKERLEKAKERQCAALQRFAERRRGRDEGGVVVIDDSDDDDAPPPPPVRHGDAGQGSSRGARVKEEKADDDDGATVATSASFSFRLVYVYVLCNENPRTSPKCAEIYRVWPNFIVFKPNFAELLLF